MGNGHLTTWTFLFVVSFRNMSEANWFLPRNLLSLPSQNGHEFPRRLWGPSPAGLWQQCQGSLSHHQQHQHWGKGLGWVITSSDQRQWAGTEEAETTQFSLSPFIWKVISGKKSGFCALSSWTQGQLFSVQTQLPVPHGHWALSWANSLNPACLLTASAHPPAPLQRVVPSSSGCCET